MFLHIILDSATIAAVEHLCVQTSTLRCSPSISPWSCPIPYLWSLSSSCVSSLIQLFPGKITHLLLYFTLLCLPMPGQTCWGLYVDVWVYLNDLTRQVKPLLPFLVGWGVQWLQWLFITLLLVGLPSLPVQPPVPGFVTRKAHLLSRYFNYLLPVYLFFTKSKKLAAWDLVVIGLVPRLLLVSEDTTERGCWGLGLQQWSAVLNRATINQGHNS